MIWHLNIVYTIYHNGNMISRARTFEGAIDAKISTCILILVGGGGGGWGFFPSIEGGSRFFSGWQRGGWGFLPRSRPNFPDPPLPVINDRSLKYCKQFITFHMKVGGLGVLPQKIFLKYDLWDGFWWISKGLSSVPWTPLILNHSKIISSYLDEVCDYG